jgi:hypothetical protein
MLANRRTNGTPTRMDHTKQKNLMNSFETWIKKKDLYTIVDPLIRPLDNPETAEET